MKRIVFMAVPFLVLSGCQVPSREAAPANRGSAPAGSPSPPAPASKEGGRAADGGTKATPAPRLLERFLPKPKNLAAGTSLPLVLDTTAASDKSQPGDAIVARLASDVKDGDRILVPKDAELRGEVLTAQGSGRVKGRARLAVSFMKLIVGGKTYDIQTSAIDVTAAPQKGRDAKIIGGGAAAGALIGAIADGGGGAAKGAVIGGAAGGGAVLATKGKEVVFPAGSRHSVTLKTALTLG